MKKITSILMLFLMCFGMAVQAADFVPESGAKYLIRNVAKNKFAIHADDCVRSNDDPTVILSVWDQVGASSLFTIEGDNANGFTIKTSDGSYVFALNTNDANSNVGVKKVTEAEVPADCKWKLNARGNNWNIIPFAGANGWNIRGTSPNKKAHIGQWSNNNSDDNSWEIAPVVKFIDSYTSIVENILALDANNPWTRPALEQEYTELKNLKPTNDTEWANAFMTAKKLATDYNNYPLVMDKDVDIFLVNRNDNHYMSLPVGGDMIMKSDNDISESAVLKFIPTATVGEYKLFNAKNNLYAGPMIELYHNTKVVSSDTEAGVYKLGTKIVANQAFLTLRGTNIPNNDDKSCLHSADGGIVRWDCKDETLASQWKVYTEDKLIANRISSCSQFEGYVGGYSSSQIAEMNSKTSIFELNDYIEHAPTISIEPGKFYRIKNIVRMLNPKGVNSNWDRLGHGGYIGTTSYPGNQTELTCGTEDLNDAGTVWEFVHNGEGYKLKNLNNGKFIGHNGNQVQNAVAMVEKESEAGVYKLLSIGNAQFKLDVNGQKLHVSTGKFMYYDNNDPASKWYLIPATELEVDMNAAGEATWASLYLPFDVTVSSDLEAYTGKLAGNTLSLNKVAEVPANTGVILKGTQNKYTLNIAGSAMQAVSDNALGGTNLNKVITEEEKANFYILGNGAAGVGLYNPNTTTLKANKAYVEAGVAAQVLKFDFNGETTGVEGVEVETENAKAVYYDLSGRRVATPAKGVYIKNGKKVFVK